MSVNGTHGFEREKKYTDKTKLNSAARDDTLRSKDTKTISLCNSIYIVFYAAMSNCPWARSHNSRRVTRKKRYKYCSVSCTDWSFWNFHFGWTIPLREVQAADFSCDAIASFSACFLLEKLKTLIYIKFKIGPQLSSNMSKLTLVSPLVFRSWVSPNRSESTVKARSSTFPRHGRLSAGRRTMTRSMQTWSLQMLSSY